MLLPFIHLIMFDCLIKTTDERRLGSSNAQTLSGDMQAAARFRGQTRQHLLALSFTAFDPKRS
jgi:hypothetical protein